MTSRSNPIGTGHGSSSIHNLNPSNGSIEEKAVKTHMLCALAVGLAGFATAASAQDTKTVVINTQVSKYCQSAFTTASQSLALGDLANQSDGRTVTAFVGATTAAMGNYMCNTPAEVKLTAGPLLNQTVTTVTDNTSFTNRVDYQALLTWGTGFSMTAASSGAAVTQDTLAANTGEVKIVVSNPVAPLRPVAGDYAGTVTLTIKAK